MSLLTLRDITTEMVREKLKKVNPKVLKDLEFTVNGEEILMKDMIVNRAPKTFTGVIVRTIITYIGKKDDKLLDRPFTGYTEIAGFHIRFCIPSHFRPYYKVTFFGNTIQITDSYENETVKIKLKSPETIY